MIAPYLKGSTLLPLSGLKIRINLSGSQIIAPDWVWASARCNNMTRDSAAAA